MTLPAVSATIPDLLRLLAVPIFAWAAHRDVETRRVSKWLWVPLSVLGVVTVVWDGWAAWTASDPVAWSRFLVPAAVSLGVVVPLAYLFWWFGFFGGADAKALFVLAILFPTFPAYVVGPWTLPLESTPVGAFSLSVLTNAVVAGAVAPVALAIRNALEGRIAPVMFVGWRVHWDEIPSTHGRLLETVDGVARGGLDLDALRMYLRWRGVALADVREDPAHYRDPRSLPAEPNPPTDGAVADGASGSTPSPRTTDDAPTKGREATNGSGDDVPPDDPWGAAAFLDDVDGSAYGTSPADLRDGLELLVEAEAVWVSPGMPFLVYVFLGLVVALTYGDLLVGALGFVLA